MAYPALHLGWKLPALLEAAHFLNLSSQLQEGAALVLSSPRQGSPRGEKAQMLEACWAKVRPEHLWVLFAPQIKKCHGCSEHWTGK